MKERIEIIKEYNTLLREIYREYELRCLADENYTYKGIACSDTTFLKQTIARIENKE